MSVSKKFFIQLHNIESDTLLHKHIKLFHVLLKSDV
jgi:hypothetical protein